MSFEDAWRELELEEWLEFHETHLYQRLALVAKAKAKAKAMSMAKSRAKALVKAAPAPPVVQVLPWLQVIESDSNSSSVVMGFNGP